MNETNTRVLLIEPMLDALGWDTRDLDVVTREYKVFDGTFLDYALLLSGRPVLFVEAKSLSKKLDDTKWMAQAINYANNEGVVWCALTDGLRYQVFKTNEPVDMSRKLVFEVDLSDARDEKERQGVIRQISLLSRESVEQGTLDKLGVRLFDDARVRLTLEELFNDPPSRFICLIRDLLPDSERTLSPSQIGDSLRRVGRSFLRSETSLVEAPVREPVPAEPSATRSRGSSYTFEHHFDDKPQVIVDLYQQLHERVIAQGEDIERLFRAQYVGYRIGKRTVCSVIPQKRRLRLVLPLDPVSHGDHPLTRDLRNIGHWGVGDIETTLESEDQLDQIMVWVADAVAEARQ